MGIPEKSAENYMNQKIKEVLNNENFFNESSYYVLRTHCINKQELI